MAPTQTFLFLISLSFLMPALGGEPAWKEGFETGRGNALPYYKDASQEEITLTTDAASEGRQFLRVALPGQRPLEGIGLTAQAEPNRMITVTAKVRGKGRMLFCLNSRNGWVYSPTLVTLTDEWKTVSLSKTLGPNDPQPRIFFLGGQEVQENAVFDLDDIQVLVAAPLDLKDVEVPPIRYEAAGLAADHVIRDSDPEALGSKVLKSETTFVLQNIPFPQTSRLMTVYLRFHKKASKCQFSLTTSRGGTRQVVRTMSPELDGHWQWVAFKGISAEEIGETLGIQISLAKETHDAISLDSIVISTREDLEPQALATAPGYGAF